jgi:hypothetical protein
MRGPLPAHQVVTALEAKFPVAAAHLDDARDDILAFTAFPARPGATTSWDVAFVHGRSTGAPLMRPHSAHDPS